MKTNKYFAIKFIAVVLLVFSTSSKCGGGKQDAPEEIVPLSKEEILSSSELEKVNKHLNELDAYLSSDAIKAKFQLLKEKKEQLLQEKDKDKYSQTLGECNAILKEVARSPIYSGFSDLINQLYKKILEGLDQENKDADSKFSSLTEDEKKAIFDSRIKPYYEAIKSIGQEKFLNKDLRLRLGIAYILLQTKYKSYLNEVDLTEEEEEE